MAEIIRDYSDVRKKSRRHPRFGSLRKGYGNWVNDVSRDANKLEGCSSRTQEEYADRNKVRSHSITRNTSYLNLILLFSSSSFFKKTLKNTLHAHLKPCRVTAHCFGLLLNIPLDERAPTHSLVYPPNYVLSDDLPRPSFDTYKLQPHFTDPTSQL